MKNLGRRIREETLNQKLILSKLPILTIPSKASLSPRKHPFAQSPMIQIENYPQNSVGQIAGYFLTDDGPARGKNEFRNQPGL